MSAPTSFADATASEFRGTWHKVAGKEYLGLCYAGAFGDAYQPKGANVLSEKWVYVTDEHERVIKVQARLVARGFNQREGIHLL